MRASFIVPGVDSLLNWDKPHSETKRLRSAFFSGRVEPGWALARAGLCCKRYLVVIYGTGLISRLQAIWRVRGVTVR